MNQKGFGIIGIIVVLVIIACAAIGFKYVKNTHKQSQSILNQESWILQRPADVPNDWMLYQNKQIGFSFYYPSYFKNVTDNLPTTPDSNGRYLGTTSNKLILTTKKDYNLEKDPHLMVYINPAFGGMCLPVVLYKPVLQGHQISFTKIHQPDVNNDEIHRKNNITCSLFMSAQSKISDINELLFSFGYSKNDAHNYEQDFDSILNSFRID